MGNKIGIVFDGFDSATNSIETAKLAEDAGLCSIWIAEHMGYREAITLCAACTSVTKTVTLVPTAISPYLWHPTPTAMAIATLSELAPKRTACCVSVGNLLNLSESGKEAVKPVLALQEYIEDLRALWAGKTLSVERINYNLNGARMDFDVAHSIPIYVASTGPKVLKMSGKLADGALLSVGLSIDYTRQCVEWIQEGFNARTSKDNKFSVASFLFFGVSLDGRKAVDELRAKLAYLFRSIKHADNIKSSGIPIDHEAIIEAARMRDFATATALIPDEAVEAFCVGGSPKMVRDQLEKYIGAGIDEPILQVVGSAQNQKLALDIASEFAR